MFKAKRKGLGLRGGLDNKIFMTTILPKKVIYQVHKRGFRGYDMKDVLCVFYVPFP